ncbi:MAG: hypothetical protein QFE16_07810 [Pseudomonadota bacterium]|nr:hypothetical protein [Pseudomonadota bacterium]
MNIDMQHNEHWPETVNVDIRVHYASGAPDCQVMAVSPCAPDRSLLALLTPARLEPSDLQRAGWSDLSGQSLFRRCLGVLALHWFGSVEMVPRVRGAPLWRSLSVEMTMPSAMLLHSLKFDLQVISDGAAMLRYQFQRNDPLTSRTVPLDVLDADPLRALLRVGASRVKPVAGRRQAESPVPRYARADSAMRESAQRLQARLPA